MAHILHVVGAFDPSASAIRCVNELNKYSRHTHELLVFNAHPLKNLYQFPEPAEFSDGMDRQRLEDYFTRADAVLYHFVGWERGVNKLKQPCAFRNINIYYHAPNDEFWSAPNYNATPPLDVYKFKSSSHVGAKQFLGEPFFWLPDLIDIYAPEYMPDWTPREPCVSFIKHSEFFVTAGFPCKMQNLCGTPHAELLRKRKTEATVVVDNCEDGHFGLAGNESLSLGLPTVVYNHPITKLALQEFAEEYPPFIEVGPSLTEAWEAACKWAQVTESQLMQWRQITRRWAETWMNSERVVEKYWEPAFEVLLCQ